jgi:hypothetical protein
MVLTERVHSDGADLPGRKYFLLMFVAYHNCVYEGYFDGFNVSVNRVFAMFSHMHSITKWLRCFVRPMQIYLSVF